MFPTFSRSAIILCKRVKITENHRTMVDDAPLLQCTRRQADASRSFATSTASSAFKESSQN
jgi:hypothetical protein